MVRAGGEPPDALVQRLIRLMGGATAEAIVPSATALAMTAWSGRSRCCAPCATP